MKPTTHQQKLKIIQAFIENYAAAHQYAPTHRDIADGTGIGLSNVRYCLDKLRVAGKIERALGIRAGRTIKTGRRYKFVEGALPEGLHERTKLILREIESYRITYQVSPTLHEMAISLHLSTSVINHHLRVLEKRGLIRRTRYKARSIVPIEKGRVKP